MSFFVGKGNKGWSLSSPLIFDRKRKYFWSFNSFVLHLTILFFIFHLGFVLAKAKFSLLCDFFMENEVFLVV